MTGEGEEVRARNYAQCESAVRDGDYDRWLATLFAPVDKRRHVFALLAFNLEIARVRAIVSEPRLGAIRLQWWREALEGERAEGSSHPVAAALFDTMARFRLPAAPFLTLIDAREFDLWDDPAPTLDWLEGYCGETASSLFRLACLVLSEGEDPGGAEAAGHAGVAWAVTGLLRALPWHVRQGRQYVPNHLLLRQGGRSADFLERRVTPPLRDALAEMRALARAHLGLARQSLGAVSVAAQPAFVALALVEPYLRRMERRGYDPFSTKIDLPSWRKIAALWLARRSLPGATPAPADAKA